MINTVIAQYKYMVYPDLSYFRNLAFIRSKINYKKNRRLLL